MPAIPVLLFFSLLLAGTFVVLFAREHRRRRFANAERDSLLPLADETPHLAAEVTAGNADAEAPHGPDHEPDHDHGHAYDTVGRRDDGSRSPGSACRPGRGNPGRARV